MNRPDREEVVAWCAVCGFDFAHADSRAPAMGTPDGPILMCTGCLEFVKLEKGRPWLHPVDMTTLPLRAVNQLEQVRDEYRSARELRAQHEAGLH